jgi:hypothetical protein
MRLKQVLKMDDSKYNETFSPRTKEILKDGLLLKTTEALALQNANNYNFARRIAQEVALIFAGQAIKQLDVGHKVRAYSHLGILAPAGIGKDFAWDLIEESGIYPTGQIKVTRLDNVTEAALSGTIFESTFVPPPTVTYDVIAVMEAATLLSGSNAASLTASLRAMLEKGQYNRRMAKIAKLSEFIETGEEKAKKYVKQQMEKWEKRGMVLDLEQCSINVTTTSSWIISSAKFGSEVANKSLLSMGDINRFRWRTYLPSREERIQITTEVGSIPPTIVNSSERDACAHAWRATISNLKQLCPTGLVVPKDSQSHYERKNIWSETLNEINEQYSEFSKPQYFDELVSLRYSSEFYRLMYQHAALKQFARTSGSDFCFPDKFVIEKEDGQFAKQLWLNEYVPGIIDVVNDILRHQPKSGGSKGSKSALGKEIVLERLKKGSAKREELLKLCENKGISSYLLDNKILPELLADDLIVQISHGWYALKGKEQPIRIEECKKESEAKQDDTISPEEEFLELSEECKLEGED